MPKTLGTLENVKNVSHHIYSQEEIDYFQINEAINNHPLSGYPANMRSKLAYKQIIDAGFTTSRYLIPGQIVVFNYAQPKFKEELEYYDATPMVIFCGIGRTKEGNIRETGLNLHYFPPYTRARVLQIVYDAFKPYWEKQFNKPSKSPNMAVDYEALKSLLSFKHMQWALRMYIPVLRGNSYLIPTRLLATAFYTEGHFSKATKNQVHKYWRKFK